VNSAERLVFFSDAVVAIALTLLALELPVPEGSTNHEVLEQFAHFRAEYTAFFISFAVIGNHWFGHHRLFGHVTGHAGGMVRWNTLWLLMIVLTPFTTRVLTADGAFETRFIVYAAVQALAGLFFLLLVHQIGRHGMLRPGTPPRVLTSSYVRLSVVVVAFLISIPVALFTHWAYVCWVLIPLGIRGVMAYLRRRRPHLISPVAPAPAS
jgi:uncharacterized membrane protein